MKKLIKGALFFALVGTVVIGCEKEDSQITRSSNTSDNTITKKTLSNDKSDDNVTYISEVNFESDFESFSETFFTENPLGLIDIEYIPGSYQYKLTTQDEGPTEPTGERVICRSSDHGTMMNCYNNHQQFAIGFSGCDYYWIERPWSNGSVWEGHVEC